MLNLYRLYVLLTLVMGISALLRGAIYPGIAGLVGPNLCWFAASGLKGSLLVGDLSQKFGGLAAAIVTVAVGVGIVYHSGYLKGLFGYKFTGVTWCLVGFAIGWLATIRQYAVS